MGSTRHFSTARRAMASVAACGLALGIATDKATTLIHIIRAQQEPSAATGPGGQQAAADLPSAA